VSSSAKKISGNIIVFVIHRQEMIYLTNLMDVRFCKSTTQRFQKKHRAKLAGQS
jgi:hypothetical protein